MPNVQRAASPPERTVRCGETTCCICGSGVFRHQNRQCGHEFLPWSQPAILKAMEDDERGRVAGLLQAELDAAYVLPTSSLPTTWRTLRVRFGTWLVQLAMKVAGLGDFR